MKLFGEPLYASSYGYIRYCPHRCLFHVHFGEMECVLETETLRQFARKITRLAARIEQSPTSSVVVPLWLCPPGMDGRAFRFCPDEVLDLADLLSGSLAQIELDEFMTNNNFTVAH